jgi:hypothetical protein
MQTIHPELEYKYGDGEPALYSSDPFLRSSPLSATFANLPAPQSDITLRSRPLELACAMIRTAYSKMMVKDGRLAMTLERIDWLKLVESSMLARLEHG